MYFCFFNDTATTEIYTLSLHDALPISPAGRLVSLGRRRVQDHLPDVGQPLWLLEHVLSAAEADPLGPQLAGAGREIGRAHVLNSSHANISYAVFCLKKKIIIQNTLHSH